MIVGVIVGMRWIVGARRIVDVIIGAVVGMIVGGVIGTSVGAVVGTRQIAGQR
jgi:uncharacterized membrane protein